MNKQRPANLNLLSMRFPVTAIISIFHRITGLLLFLAMPVMLWWFKESLHSTAQFDKITHLASCLSTRIVFWVIGSAMIFHVVAGIRHLLMDMGVAEEKQSSKCSSWTALLIAGILIIAFGVYLWP